jgi:hypothetical protein
VGFFINFIVQNRIKMKRRKRQAKEEKERKEEERLKSLNSEQIAEEMYRLQRMESM